MVNFQLSHNVFTISYTEWMNNMCVGIRDRDKWCVFLYMSCIIPPDTVGKQRHLGLLSKL